MTTKSFLGHDINKAYDDIVNAKEVPKPKVITPANIPNPNEWIILPGTNDYADTLVQLKRDLHNNNWEQTHRLLQQDGHYMLPIRPFADFLKLLKSDKEIHLADGKTLLSPAARAAVLDDILTVRNDYRAEWLDADFKVGPNGEMIIKYNHRIVNGLLLPQKLEMLTDYLTTNKNPGIDLEDWLNNMNQYGLPTPKTKKGSLYYFAPMFDNNSVAGFWADSYGAFLGCSWDPADSSAGLGVRRAREK